MAYRFEYRAYRRPFRCPLQTHHGLWREREGIVLRLTDEQGRTAYGEVAPLPWFGSETLEQALQFCRRLPAALSEAAIFSILPTLPACQFGFETVFRNLTQTGSDSGPDLLPQRCAALLPNGIAALSAWPSLWQRGHRTFKCKIGVAAIADELQWLEALLARLPLGAKLRLDANGGLDELTARHWLDWCDRAGHRIEYIEQPLAPDQFCQLLRLGDRYRTPIALDESIASLEQLKTHYYRGWQGVYVLKAAIIGSPHRLRQFCRDHAIDWVVSSVFETAIGRQAVIDLALSLDHPRALGVGTEQWFGADGLDQPDWDWLWQRL